MIHYSTPDIEGLERIELWCDLCSELMAAPKEVERPAFVQSDFRVRVEGEDSVERMYVCGRCFFNLVIVDFLEDPRDVGCSEDDAEVIVEDERDGVGKLHLTWETALQMMKRRLALYTGGEVKDCSTCKTHGTGMSFCKHAVLDPPYETCRGGGMIPAFICHHYEPSCSDEPATCGEESSEQLGRCGS